MNRKAEICLILFMLTATISGCCKSTMINKGKSDLIGKIVFVSGREREGQKKIWQIYIMNADGTDQRVLSSRNGGNPKWSPDGGKIATGGICIMDANGENAKILANAKYGEYPDWAPNGKKIVFVLSEGGTKTTLYGLYVINADGTNKRKLFSIKGIIGSPSWSPSGEKIAFYQTADYGSGMEHQIFICNEDGKDIQQLTFDQNHFSLKPAWSPDGNSIAFIRYTDRGAKLWAMDADGSNQRQVVAQKGQDDDPAWSPDGTKIVFSSVREGRSPWRASEIYVINADGTNERRLTEYNGIGGDQEPDWWASID